MFIPSWTHGRTRRVIFWYLYKIIKVTNGGQRKYRGEKSAEIPIENELSRITLKKEKIRGASEYEAIRSVVVIVTPLLLESTRSRVASELYLGLHLRELNHQRYWYFAGNIFINKLQAQLQGFYRLFPSELMQILVVAWIASNHSDRVEFYSRVFLTEFAGRKSR